MRAPCFGFPHEAEVPFRGWIPRGPVNVLVGCQKAKQFVTILFGEGVAEIFGELPEQDKREAAVTLDLLANFPRMCPVRRRGVMKGYRYFLAGRHFFYYSVAGEEVRISAIIPAVMRLA